MVRIAAIATFIAGLSVCAEAQPGTSSVTGPGSDSSGRPSPRDSSVAGTSAELFGVRQTPKLDVQPVFFPALIPALGSELPPAPSVRDAIWSDLAPFANELFYAPLGTRLAGNELNRRHRQRLDAYRAARDQALAELRTALASGSSEAVLTLAVRQDASLQALTSTADTLRRDLYAGGFAVSSGDWNQYRNWRLGEGNSKRTPQELLYDEFSVLRGAVYYQEGLSPDQRRLLQEIVTELAEALGERPADDFGESFEPAQKMWFLPHGSRLRLPAALPAETTALVREFAAAKSALKRELRDALFDLDRESGGRREKALQALAARQTPALDALEPLAAKLRAALAGHIEAAPPAAHASLPPQLVARINAYLQEKSELQRAAQRQTQTAPGTRDKQSAAAGRAALAEFEQRNRARFAALAEEAKAIREEVARTAVATPDIAAKSVDALLADFMGAFKRQQLQALYEDYRTAMLRPDLSPPQRRLLFNAAVSQLDLPGAKDWQALPE